jgi:Holliday junction resolvase
MPGGSASKRKGTAWESQVVTYLREHGQPYAERRALSGASDKGDVAGVPGVMIECKAEKTITLGAYADEVKIQTTNARAQIGVAVVKRRNRGPADAYVVMTLEQFATMLADANDPSVAVLEAS